MLSRRLYYLVKPFFSRRLQIAFRRFHAQRVLRHCGDCWPINPAAGRTPDGWPGWPEGKEFGLVLTHDVEGERGVQRVRQLAELEMELGFRSSFNFVPEGGYTVPAELRTWLTDNGFEVGVQDLHHDAKLYRSREHFLESAQRINGYMKEWDAVGFRSAFMLHKLDWLHDLNILYDASTFDTDPFEPQPDGMETIFPFWVGAGREAGVRGQGSGGGPSDVRGQMTDDGWQRTEAAAPGTSGGWQMGGRDGGQTDGLPTSALGPRSSVFGPPQPRRRRGGGYVELPYTLVQDFNLFIILRAKTIDIWKRKLDWIVEHGGMVLLDTHPDYMAFGGSKPKPVEYPVEFYSGLLQYIRSKYSGAFWHSLPRELASHVVEIKNATLCERESELIGAAVSASAETREVVSDPPRNAEIASAPSSTLDGAQFESGPSAARKPHSRTSDATPFLGYSNLDTRWRLRGKRAAVLLFSHYPADPRPRRAAEALAMEGVTIDLICLQETPDEPRRESVNGVNVFRIPLRRHRGGKLSYIGQYSVFVLTSFAYLAFRSLTHRYDFVHVHNMPDVLVFSALVPKVLGARVVLDLHDPMPELMQTIFKLPENSFSVRLLKRLEKWSIGFADLVLTVNVACKKIYSGRSCVPEKINVVLNSPDDHIFPFRPPPSRNGTNGRDAAKPFVILYHGSLVRRNGFDLAVDALQTVRKSIPSARLMVCGQQTPFFDSVMESANERGLREKIDYLGARSVEQIVEAIDSCDLGIIPNHRNIFTEINTPTRIFEYLALGKPVIAPRAKGIQDYFGERDLIYFKLGEAADLAQQIEFVFAHQKEVEQIVKRGQAVYRAHTWTQEKSILLNSFGELL